MTSQSTRVASRASDPRTRRREVWVLLLLAVILGASIVGANTQSTISEIGQYGEWKLILQKHTPPLEPPIATMQTPAG